MEKVICTQDFPIVETPGGKLHGYMRNEVYHFYGVKYGTARRFQLPELVQPWEGVKEARSYGFVCPQLPKPKEENPLEFSFERPHRYWPSNEECLYLNIWTKSIESGVKKPVMVWIHGGGFAEGSSIEQPAYEGYHLCDHGDVVVVSVNHRINCLGYLDLSSFGEKYKYSGCVGNADLVLALRWVRENISCFGGDPDCVTIFGQSGGGSKVLALMQMPAADGLYHRAIVQSGAFAPVCGMTREKKKLLNRQLGDAVAEQLELDGNTIGQIDGIPYEQLAAACGRAAVKLGRPGGLMLFEPSPVEGYYMGTYDYAGFRPEVSHIPVMVGTTLGEFSFRQLFGDKERYSEEEKMDLLKARYGGLAWEVAEEFRRVYPGKDILYALSVDTLFRGGAASYLKARLEADGGKLYNYLFSVIVPYLGGMTPWHCAEIPYVFRNVDAEPMHCCGHEYMERLQEEVSNAWLAFARSGDPSTPQLSWPCYTQQDPQVMYFDESSQAVREKDQKLQQLICS